MKPHSCKVPIRFVDIDAMGHVNNAVHLNIIEEARIQYFKDLVGEDWDWERDGVILARTEIDYQHPIRMNDEVIVESHCENYGNKSITMVHHLKSADGRSFAKAKVILVCFDHKNRQSITVPEKLKRALES